MFAYLNAEVLPKLIPAHSRILAAVSGGPDSIALAHILYCYRKANPAQNITVIVSHVNHQVRKESLEEAKLVERLALQWGFPFILHEFDAKEHARQSGLSFQEASRNWRYARFKEDMAEWNCNLLATAHHLGDQAETVLYRLLRGSGPQGLAGIYPQKDNIIRPLLTVSKEMILDYCAAQNLPYAVDQSNWEPCYARNKIRLHLLPILEREYNVRIQEALGRTAELIRWDMEYLEQQVEKKWSSLVLKLEAQSCLISYQAFDEPEAILSRILRRAAAQVSGEPRGLEYKYIQLMMKEGRKRGWRQDLPGMKVEARKNGFLLFRGELEQQDQTCAAAAAWEIHLWPSRWFRIPQTDLEIGIFEEWQTDREILYWTEIYLDKLVLAENPPVCRTRKAGDKMFFRKVGHKSLKKVFQEKDISEQERKLIPLVADQDKIIWIPGVCRSDSYLADHTSCKLYGLVSRIRMTTPN